MKPSCCTLPHPRNRDFLRAHHLQCINERSGRCRAFYPLYPRLVTIDMSGYVVVFPCQLLPPILDGSEVYRSAHIADITHSPPPSRIPWPVLLQIVSYLPAQRGKIESENDRSQKWVCDVQVRAHTESLLKIRSILLPERVHLNPIIYQTSLRYPPHAGDRLRDSVGMHIFQRLVHEDGPDERLFARLDSHVITKLA